MKMRLWLKPLENNSWLGASVSTSDLNSMLIVVYGCDSSLRSPNVCVCVRMSVTLATAVQDFQRTSKGLPKDFQRTSKGLSKDFQRTSKGLAKDF